MKRDRLKSPRRTPQQERSQATLDFLLQATLELISREGIEAVTIPVLADRAGMSPAAIYRYFPTKTALFAAAAEKMWTEGLARITETALDLHTRRVPAYEAIATIVGQTVELIGKSAPAIRSGQGRMARVEERRAVIIESSKLVAAMLEVRRAEEPGTIRSGDLYFRCLLVNVMIVESASAVALREPERFRSGELQRELIHAAATWLLCLGSAEEGLLPLPTSLATLVPR
jgi:AcrR family transcriptional regulator